jgi:hypothetical protein
VEINGNNTHLGISLILESQVFLVILYLKMMSYKLIMKHSIQSTVAATMRLEVLQKK